MFENSHVELIKILNCLYPKPVDEIISSQQFIDQELECMFSSGLMEGKNIKGPLIHLLKDKIFMESSKRI